MHQYNFIQTAVLLIVLLMLPTLSSAKKIPLGINSSHGFFTQTLWHERDVYLCLANRTLHDETLLISKWFSSSVPAELLIRWPSKAGSVDCQKMTTSMPGQLIELKVESGPRLGLLNLAGKPQVLNVDRDVFSGFQGANGTCTTKDSWIELPALWLRSGKPATLTMLTYTGDEKIHIEFPVNTDLNLPHLQIQSVVTSGLSVEYANHVFTVAQKISASNEAVHQIELEIDVPVVKQPAMFLLSGRKRIADKGWHCFLRGVMIAPSK